MRAPALLEKLSPGTVAQMLLHVVGLEAEALLSDLAAAAARRNLVRGHPAGAHLRRWRARIAALVAKAVARSLRAALQPGRGALQ